MTFRRGFLRYRFEYASLVWDSLATVFNKRFRWHARVVALFFFPLLLGLPGAIIYVGSHPFGNPYWFCAALGLWPILLESIAYQVRQASATHATEPEPGGFDFFLFSVFTLLAVASAALLFALDKRTWEPKWVGLLWGIALAGGVDFVRSGISSGLSLMGGYPLYGPRPLK